MTNYETLDLSPQQREMPGILGINFRNVDHIPIIGRRHWVSIIHARPAIGSVFLFIQQFSEPVVDVQRGVGVAFKIAHHPVFVALVEKLRECQIKGRNL